MIYRYAFTFALAFSFLPAALAALPSTATNKDKTMLLNKPVFTLRLNMQDCRYSVNLNGARINRNDGGESLTVNIPVNHWMRTGANEITLSLLTFKGKYPISPEARCEVSLQVRPDDGTEAQTVTISRLVFSGKLASVGSKGIEESTPAGKYDSEHQFLASRNGDVTISETSIGLHPTAKESKQVRQTITLTTPFPEWAFFKSDNLPNVFTMLDADYDRYLDSVLVSYKRISDAIKSKNVDSILPMFEERNREIDQAFYSPPGTTAEKIASAFKDAANDPDLTPLTIKADFLMVRTHDNNKLLELVREGGGDAIVFNIRGGGSESYPIIFRKQGNQWIITR